MEKKDKIKQLYQKLIDNTKGEKKSINIKDINIDIFPNVFSPSDFYDSLFFVENFPFTKEKDILEIGTGTGILAIYLAKYGNNNIVATDINTDAYSNAIHNVRKNKLEHKINVRKGYIFEPILEAEKFDIIFWNIPFCYVDNSIKSEFELPNKITDYQKSIFNPDYKYLYDYLLNGFNFLKKDGQLLLGFSPTIGNVDVFNKIIKQLKIKKQIIVDKTVNINDDKETIQIIRFKK